MDEKLKKILKHPGMKIAGLMMIPIFLSIPLLARRAWQYWKQRQENRELARRVAQLTDIPVELVLKNVNQCRRGKEMR